MKYNYMSLEKENDLNKILRSQKARGHSIHILFHSLWDNNSIKLLEQVQKNSTDSMQRKDPLYGVDSFNMPHSFVIFGTTKSPALVSIERGRVVVEDYLARIYKKLRI